MPNKKKGNTSISSMEGYLKRYYPKTGAQILLRGKSESIGLGVGSAKEVMQSFDHTFNMSGRKA